MKKLTLFEGAGLMNRSISIESIDEEGNKRVSDKLQPDTIIGYEKQEENKVNNSRVNDKTETKFNRMKANYNDDLQLEDI